MRSLANVAIHPSQFPDHLRLELLRSLRARELNPKFLYDGYKQTQKWLALHEACSPARNDLDCQETYDRAFKAALDRSTAHRIHVISLGCGGGQKDVALLKRLRQSGKQVSYVPCDVSVAMVLTARRSALEIVDPEACFPLVCDLLASDDLARFLREQTPAAATRLITFFGLVPNFEPDLIFPCLTEVLRPNDGLLLSANLVPGSDYAAGVQRVLALYDNAWTRDWLMTFLLELGVERDDGALQFDVQDSPDGAGLKRIVATFHFQRARSVRVHSEEVKFQAGESLRVFFSYRHTPDQVSWLLRRYGIAELGHWIAGSGEEGVFLCADANKTD